MKIKWTANWGLKIGSLVFAAILWLLVTNINDPLAKRTFDNVPVKIINTELLTESNLVYEVLDGTDIINTVTIWAPRSIRDKLDKSNIVATADLNDLGSLDTISIKLTTNLYANNLESITGSIDTVKLKIEEEKPKTLPLKPTISGEMTEGYILGEITTEQNLVKITGPESLVDSIKSAVVDVSVSEFTTDIETDAEIRLLDVDGKEVNLDRITQNIKVVRVKVNILQTKNVPIHYAVTGTPVAGFRATGVVDVNPGSVLIAGKSSVIRNVNAIEIPESVLDITGSTENFVTTIDFLQYLPENVRMGDTTANTEVTFTVYVEQEVSRNISIRENRINIINLPEGYTADYTGIEGEANITLIGLRGDIDNVRIADITGVIDIQKLMAERNMEELAEGFYMMEVDFNLDGNISILEPVEVTVHVTENID